MVNAIDPDPVEPHHFRHAALATGRLVAVSCGMHTRDAVLLVAAGLLSAVYLAACSGDVVSAGSPPAAGGSAGGDAALDSGGTGGSGGSGGVGGLGGSGGGPADVMQPPAPVTLRFRNDSGMTIFIDWSWASAPVPQLFSAGQSEPMALSGACTSECGLDCACIACDMAPPQAKVMAPGAVVEYVWDGTYYTFAECGAQGCPCHEGRMAGLGAYTASVAGALGVTGGTPQPDDPTVLQDAWLDTTNGSCQAGGDFQLSPAAGVFEFTFACAMP